MLAFLKDRRRKQFDKIWLHIIEKAKSHMLLENELPSLHKKDIWLFIETWNKAFKQSTEQQRVALAVLAYRLEIHRYAAGMLINGEPKVRLSGIILLGHMGDETAWPILKSLVQKANTEISQVAFTALKQINKGRAAHEFSKSKINHQQLQR